MYISLVGGPYDGDIYDIDVDRKGQPVLDVLNMPPRSLIGEGIIDHLAIAPKPAQNLSIIRYLLVEVPVVEYTHCYRRIPPTKWCWEYHYEG